MAPRDAFYLLKPVADASDARRAAWMRTHRLPGDTPGSLRRRYSALRLTERRKDLRAVVGMVLAAKAERERLAARLPGFIPLRDDGLTDDVWSALHPERQYRVRPHRDSDGIPAAFDVPCVTVVHVPTGAFGMGVPVDRLQVLGAVAYPRDCDRWAELLFLDQWAREERAKGAVH